MQNSSFPEPYGVLFSPAPEFDEGADEKATAAIRLLEPAFKGVVFRYNTPVGFVEDANKENAVLKFDYSLISGVVPDSKKVDFEITLGNLLYDILLDSIKRGEEENQED